MSRVIIIIKNRQLVSVVFLGYLLGSYGFDELVESVFVIGVANVNVGLFGHCVRLNWQLGNAPLFQERCHAFSNIWSL